MAIIGFIFLNVFGFASIGSAIVNAFFTVAFSGGVNRSHFITYAGVGVGILYYAWTHAPFTIFMGAV